MIVKMKKVYLVSRAGQRDRLLGALRDLGVVHLEPVTPGAGAPEEVTAALARAARAIQVIQGVEPAGDPPDLDAGPAVDEVLDIVQRTDELRARLGALHREADRLELWGELRIDRLEALEAAGVRVRFYSVPGKSAGEVRADLVEVLMPLPGKRVLVAAAGREGEPDVPEGALLIEQPKRDLPTVRAEAREVEAAMAADAARLARLARLAGALARRHGELAAEAAYETARAGALTGEHLFAAQGWAPADAADALAADLARRDLDAAVETRKPAEDETPPTLIRYPRWAMPIKGLFDILGTLPGYREIDLSVFFMIALPIFTAMLIGDAGYGLLLLLAPAAIYRRAVAKAGRPLVHLVMVFGGCTLIWGVLTANYFGLSPQSVARAGGWVAAGGEGDVRAMLSASGGWAGLGRAMMAIAPFWDPDPETVQFILMKISLILGVVHLTLGQLRAALAKAPSQQALAPLGWAVFLWGTFGVIWRMMFAGIDRINWRVSGVVLAVGGALAVLFTYPSRNPLKRIGIGLASSLLPTLGTFGDTMSYLRLMAVGMASYYIAAAFNGIALQIGSVSPWLWVAAAPVLLFGHALNIGMAMIAVFAHGLRLNMLEFSNNVGVQWAGYAYQPFAAGSFREN